MKQHITEEQFLELEAGSKTKIIKWWNDWLKENIEDEKELEDGFRSLPLLSIGQMIEFLTDHGKNFAMGYDRNPDLWTFMTGKWWDGYKPKEDLVPELCDALWEAVKEVLLLDTANYRC